VRIHHLNCGTMCPPIGRLVRGEGGLLSRGRLICHCLLIETSAGLVLVDTGIGLADLQHPDERLGRGFLSIVRPALDPKETAIHQVEQLGLSPSDVRHIVLTHLDLDHAGGLTDFPEATVHVYRPEHDAAMARATLRERERYHPAQWAHAPRFRLYDGSGERWFGFERVSKLEGIPPEILIVPVTGHSRGHAAIAVRIPPRAAADDAPWSQRGAEWLLHAGDAYFHRGEMDPNRRTCPLGLELFQRAVAIDDAARRANQERLRELARREAGVVRVFCAHDDVELERLQSESRTAARAEAERSAA
jgi:glyoxylase-like metal-dependent hydrolase (beta-lactamase superfamily II)